MILITGADGQLGRELCTYLKQLNVQHIGLNRKELDITDHAAVSHAIALYKPLTVFCCAAYTNVDKAESEEDKCFGVNADGVLYLADACEKINAALVYPGTDYIFDGKKGTPYEVDDAVNPLSVYAKSKALGELNIDMATERYYIVRVSRLFGHHGGNFVKTMLRLSDRDALRVVDDQIASPTYVNDLVPLLYEISQSGKYGMYHATNQGACSFAEWAEEIFRLADKPVRVERVSAKEYGAPAPRPAYSELSPVSLDKAGFERLPHWKDALERFLLQCRVQGVN
jgi:dTDP-4-dehydrorhamnose reductase